ncbi:MAG: GNAT family N-acetyltransferase [Sphingomonadaceae bacterium]|nr:GNAT family N-acetyltransferase [Sphingomonadaceae bacterium]
MTDYRWRPLREADLEGVAAIAALTFPQHPEELACFAERLALSPAWCFGLQDGASSLLGYLIAYPWPLGSVPPLNALLGSLPPQADALFLHDLAIHPNAAGSGQGAKIVGHLASDAFNARFSDIALVAVNQTMAFWQGQGFRAEAPASNYRAKLASYGGGARYMRRHLEAAARG